MTTNQYWALQISRGDKYTEIVHLLDAAGENGYALLRDLFSLTDEVDAAYRALTHEERMEILAEENRQRQRLLEEIEARQARNATLV